MGSACPLILSHRRQLTLAPLSSLLTEAEDTECTSPPKMTAPHSTSDIIWAFYILSQASYRAAKQANICAAASVLHNKPPSSCGSAVCMLSQCDRIKQVLQHVLGTPCYGVCMTRSKCHITFPTIYGVAFKAADANPSIVGEYSRPPSRKLLNFATTAPSVYCFGFFSTLFSPTKMFDN